MRWTLGNVAFALRAVHCGGIMRTEERMAMDIEQFYDEDPRRRSSEETEFGRDWSDGSGVRSELSWVADTGELYVMKEPDAPINMDPVGDEFVESLGTEAMTVEVLGTVEDRAHVDQLLDGWQDAMVKPNSLSWVRERVAQLSQ